MLKKINFFYPVKWKKIYLQIISKLQSFSREELHLYPLFGFTHFLWYFLIRCLSRCNTIYIFLLTKHLFGNKLHMSLFPIPKIFPFVCLKEEILSITLTVLLTSVNWLLIQNLNLIYHPYFNFFNLCLFLLCCFSYSKRLITYHIVIP